MNFLFRNVSACCKQRRLRLEAIDLFHIRDQNKKLKVQLLLLMQKAEKTNFYASTNDLLLLILLMQ